jgi:hypothetical protein
MNKLTIYATGNERVTGDYNVSYYIVEKSDLFFDFLGRLLNEVVGMDDGSKKAHFFIKLIDSEEELTKKDINKLTDAHEKYESKGNRVDVFYGKERVFITFRKSREAREKFSEFVKKNAEWIKVEQTPMEYLGDFNAH